MNENRWIYTAAAAATLLLAGGAAQALTVVARPWGTGFNLLNNACNFSAGASSDATVTGCLSRDHDQAVTLTSDESIDYASGGQARIVGTDSDYSRLSITVDDRSMKTMVLNLNASANGYVSFSDGSSTSGLFALKGVGNNFFTVRGPFETLSFTTYADRLGTERDLIHDTRQVRFSMASPITPVPEPSTYALMLAGLGVIGYMVRRRRNHDGA